MPQTSPPASPPTGLWHKLPVWGRVGTEAFERFSDDLARASQDVPLSRGLGRSYGDSSLPPTGRPQTLNTTLADRILDFDEATGLLCAESGLSLYDLNWTLLPRGWFVPVTPGTQFVTLGGMIAADVHGKNHHVDGTFGKHVTRMKVKVASGQVVECSRQQHPDLFLATIGGMGLTGHILEATFKMVRVPSPWIWQETEQIDNLDHFLTGLKEAAKGWPMTVGWIDSLSRGANMGRGILMKGRWATPQEAPSAPPKPKPHVTFPVELPGWVLNAGSVLAFNTVFYHKHIPRKKQGIVHPETFFYPLDIVYHWNRMYGRRGMTQYQCVLPEAQGTSAVRGFVELLTQRGGASFLSVIKDCGEQGDGILSFPMPGTSIAVDLQLTDDTQALTDALNAYVISKGGRIYLAKDLLTRAEDFQAMEPRLARFLEVRRAWDPHGKLKSAQSVRLFGDSQS
jgi:FAD/FMN-containing dehydrogenase